MSTPTFANSAAAFAAADRRPPTSASRPVKLFIGGLTRNTTTKLLRDHFSQYGRILDCVAMVQPDGRPRGFGYVTLDSAVAAERCLSEPMVIDGRILDMKPAVPGTSGTNSGERSLAGQRRSPSYAHGAGASTSFPLGAWDMPSCSPGAAEIMSMQAAMAAQTSAAWAAAWAATSPEAVAELDCLNLMRRGSSGSTRASVCESLNLLTGDASRRSLCSSFGMSPSSKHIASMTPLGGATGFGALSSYAPEFVPGNAATDDDDTPEKVALPVKSSTRRRTIFGDITNLSSPMKVTLPATIKSNIMMTSFGGLDESGSFRSRRFSSLEIYEDEREGGVDARQENVAAQGLSLPPGLEPPEHLRPFVKQLGAAPALLR
mmetsp:Transcript_8289/g.23115  ORF Transcript_8289/g.23115 Transcript_8289/m.23115 type:complete len:375 (+) Transcript_8289:75-1199(+)